MVYCLTVSGHLKYNYESNSMARRHWSQVSDLGYSEAVTAYLPARWSWSWPWRAWSISWRRQASWMTPLSSSPPTTTPMVSPDEEYSELLGHEVDPVFEIYKNTLILWSADIDEPVHVDKFCSSLDVMPTLANLFGLEYDSRLIMGRDILSDEPGWSSSPITALSPTRDAMTPPPTPSKCGTAASLTRSMWRSASPRCKTGWPTRRLFWITTITGWYLELPEHEKRLTSLDVSLFLLSFKAPGGYCPWRTGRLWRASAPIPPRRR